MGDYEDDDDEDAETQALEEDDNSEGFSVQGFYEDHPLAVGLGGGSAGSMLLMLVSCGVVSGCRKRRRKKGRWVQVASDVPHYDVSNSHIRELEPLSVEP